MRLHRLTGLEREKIAEELEELAEKHQGAILEILESRERRLEVLSAASWRRSGSKYADPRRTTIEEIWSSSPTSRP